MGEGDVAGSGKTARDQDAWIVFEDESGQSIRPPKGRTWSRKGHTPIVTVTGSGKGRVSVTALVAIKPGHRSHLIYRMLIHRGRKGEKKGFTEPDYAAVLDAAHAQLGGPIVMVWDNETRHVDARMRALIASREWLTVFQLPSYAPDLNPAEGVWAHLKRGLANLAATTTDHLAAVVKARLKRMQYRPDLLEGFVAQTGLTLTGP